MITSNIPAAQFTKSTHEILSSWVLRFCYKGIHPKQVEILFDSFRELDDGTIDDSQLCFAVFIHKLSANPSFVFPDLEYEWGFISHQQSEQACFFVWVDIESDNTEVTDPMTELCIDDLHYVIHQIEYLRQTGQPQIHSCATLCPQ